MNLDYIISLCLFGLFMVYCNDGNCVKVVLQSTIAAATRKASSWSKSVNITVLISFGTS